LPETSSAKTWILVLELLEQLSDLHPLLSDRFFRRLLLVIRVIILQVF